MSENNSLAPLVSVVMITYNHESFIAEAIEGVLMQKLYSSVEFIIANDCSTDRTEEIIQKYIKNHPSGHRIVYIRHETNRGMMSNFIWALQQAKGKYIALCEGDDCWTDPYKLQKQVDFLEFNEDYAICFHPVQILRDNELSPDGLAKVSDTTTIEDLAKGNYIHTPSVMIRNLPNNWNFDLFKKSPVGDYVLYMMSARCGKIKKLSEEMAVYRQGQGIWSSQTRKQIYFKWVKVIHLLLKDFKDLPTVTDELISQKKNCERAIKRENPYYKLFNKFKTSLQYRLNKREDKSE